MWREILQYVASFGSLAVAIAVAYLAKKASDNAAKTKAETDERAATLTAEANRDATRTQAESSPYTELARRTTTLERQVVRLLGVLQSLHGDFHLVADSFHQIVAEMGQGPATSEAVQRAFRVIEKQRQVRDTLIERALAEPGDGYPEEGIGDAPR